MSGLTINFYVDWRFQRATSFVNLIFIRRYASFFFQGGGFVFPEIFDFLDFLLFASLSNFCQARPILTILIGKNSRN